jgi:hypothetical protein
VINNIAENQSTQNNRHVLGSPLAASFLDHTLPIKLRKKKAASIADKVFRYGN